LTAYRRGPLPRRNAAVAALVEQLSDGWATVFVFERPFQQVTRFRTVQRRARSGGRGVWSKCGGNFHSEQ